MSPERRKLVLLLIAIVVAVIHLIDEAPDSDVQLWPQQTVVNLQHALTTAQAASAAMLSQLSLLQLLHLNKKTRDRLLGPQAGLIKLPRNSISKFYVVPRDTQW